MMSRFFDEERVYCPANGVAVDLYDERGRLLVIQFLKRGENSKRSEYSLKAEKRLWSFFRKHWWL